MPTGNFCVENVDIPTPNNRCYHCHVMKRSANLVCDTVVLFSIKNLDISRCCTYLCPKLPMEHWPSTTPRHPTLFWTALAIPDQLVPCCFSSAPVSHLQLLRGRPLFLFPCGFQVRAWRVVLDGFLCPILKSNHNACNRPSMNAHVGT